MEEPVVFDFDKTLTYRDTTLPFFRYCAACKGDSFLYFKVAKWYLAAVLVKAGLLSNTKIKNLGISWFLSGMNRQEIAQRGKDFAREIKTNKIFAEVFPLHPEAIVISASLEDYVKPLFPHHRVIASVLAYDRHEKVSRLAVNCYGEKKRQKLHDRNIKRLSVVYTDSLSDRPLMEMARCTYWVKGDKLEEL